MALSFNGLEPVRFGDKDCTPKITTEIKLRLEQIKEYNDSADEVLASAFPEDEMYVKDFLRTKMTAMDKERLHAYLYGGETLLNTLLDGVREVMKK